jgi:hypothetical protein
VIGPAYGRGSIVEDTHLEWEKEKRAGYATHEVKNEITIDIKGGSRRLVVTPDIGKVMFIKSMRKASWRTI